MEFLPLHSSIILTQNSEYTRILYHMMDNQKWLSMGSYICFNLKSGCTDELVTMQVIFNFRNPSQCLNTVKSVMDNPLFYAWYFDVQLENKSLILGFT